MAVNEKSPSRQADKFNIRFPGGLRDRIADAAAANHRSMNAEIVARLLKSLEITYQMPSEVRDEYRMPPEEAALLNAFRAMPARRQRALLDLLAP